MSCYRGVYRVFAQLFALGVYLIFMSCSSESKAIQEKGISQLNLSAPAGFQAFATQHNCEALDHISRGGDRYDSMWLSTSDLDAVVCKKSLGEKKEYKLLVKGKSSYFANCPKSIEWGSRRPGTVSLNVKPSISKPAFHRLGGEKEKISKDYKLSDSKAIEVSFEGEESRFRLYVCYGGAWYLYEGVDL